MRYDKLTRALSSTLTYVLLRIKTKTQTNLYTKNATRVYCVYSM